MSRVPCLVVGIPGTHPAVKTHLGTLSGEFDAAKIPGQVKRMSEMLDKSPYDVEMFFYAPEDEPEKFASKLKERPWEAVLIGWGVRGHRDLTPFFELMVNQVHELAPQAHFCFQNSPETTLESLERNVPIIEEKKQVSEGN